MREFYSDGGVEAVKNSIEAGVTHLVLPCVDLSSLKEMNELQSNFPDHIRLALGLHPTELTDDWQKHLDIMESLLPGDFCAIGEIGIDLYHDASRREDQKRAFAQQINWAIEYDLPVIIHCREGLDDTLEVLSTFGNSLPRLIFHSFTGGPVDVRRIRKICDPWFGVNGVVTFKNASLLREALPEIGLDRILLETDSPWLSPAPKRGQLNESARIVFIRDKVAEVLGVSSEEVERATDASASSLFFTAAHQSAPN